jgi:hypothetical protein
MLASVKLQQEEVRKSSQILNTGFSVRIDGVSIFLN